MNNLFPALIPLTVFIVALVAKRGAIISALLGIASVLFVVYFYQADYQISWNKIISNDLPVVLILTLSVALVIFPGQVMNSLLKQTDTIVEIGKFIESIEIPRLKLATIIVLGIAPALESLTGFGVSLFFTVPVLMQLFSLRKALILSLLSMNIMPWGTLALSTLIGAQITDIPFSQLSYQTSLTSFFVFPVIGFLVYDICRTNNSSQFSQFIYPIAGGFILAAFLVFYNIFSTPELAGVFAGASVTVVGFVLELFIFNRKAFFRLEANRSLLMLFSPYIILIVLISLSRIEIINSYLRDFYIIKNGGISFSPLTSPGVFIVLTVIGLCVCFHKFSREYSFILDGIKRAFYPVIGILMFVIFAQIQRSSGILKALASEGANLSLTENIFISPLIGMISGYTTGSNVGGNVLFMSLQSEIGTFFNQKLLFAALQNSSAGHAVFLSVPIILLTFSIAQIEGRDVQTHRNWLIRHTLLYAPFIYLALVAAFYLLIAPW